MHKLDFDRNFGAYFIQLYDGSPYSALSALYPEAKLLSWKFNRIPKDYFANIENVQKYVDWLVVETKVRSASDLKASHFLRNGGSNLLSRNYWSPKNILKLIDPLNDNVSLKYGNRVESGGHTARPRNFWVLPFSLSQPSLSFFNIALISLNFVII